MGWICGSCGTENPYIRGHCRACGGYALVVQRLYSGATGVAESAVDFADVFLEKHPAPVLRRRTLGVARGAALVAALACTGLAAYTAGFNGFGDVGARLGDTVGASWLHCQEVAQNRAELVSRAVARDADRRSERGQYLTSRVGVNPARDLSAAFELQRVLSSARMNERSKQLQFEWEMQRHNDALAISGRADHVGESLKTFNISDLTPGRLWGDD